jgi:hypothetical protein
VVSFSFSGSLPRTSRPGRNLRDSGLGVLAVWMNMDRFWNVVGDDDDNDDDVGEKIAEFISEFLEVIDE